MIARIAGISVVALVLFGVCAVAGAAEPLVADQAATLLSSGPTGQAWWQADEAGPATVGYKERRRYERQHQYRNQYRNGDGQTAGGEEIGTRSRQRDQQRDQFRDRQRDGHCQDQQRDQQRERLRSRDGSCQ